MSVESLKDTKQKIIEPKKMGLLVENPVYKPFRYPWCYDAWLTQQRIHWLPEEVPLGDDVRDWQKNLSESEKNLLTQIFRFFTQADVEVNNCYLRHYTTVFKPTEVLMMMTAFAAMETVHIAAYSHLLDTIGMPETEYSAFLQYKEMKDKYDYMQNFNVNSKEDIAKTVAVFSAFTEGLQLFASFAILLNFPRHNKLKGMGQIVTWSVRDETLHCNSMIRIFKEFIKENPEIWTPKLKKELYEACRTIIEHEDAFIDLAFEMGPMQGFNVNSKEDIAKTVAVFSAFTEGLQLFASFAILLNFPRHNKLKGMGQIVTWSVRDETLHCNSMIRIFKEFIKENPEIWTPKLKKELYEACRTIVEHEDAFIDLAFEMGPMEGLTAQEVKDYIRFIGNRRLVQLGLEPIYDVEKNPLGWLDTMLNAVEHMNFFEGRATEYSKASTQGTWVEAFS